MKTTKGHTTKLDKTIFSKIANENKLIALLFAISTAFFIYQHAVYLSWDFSTYVLNAKYLFANGGYFEILRPPLMSLILGIFSFAGWIASEYLFIVLASLLFLYSSVKLSRAIKFNPCAFYALSLNIYLLSYGLINGTELLSLIFLELFIAFLIENKYVAGLFLGLSVLSRYTSLAYFPLILLFLRFKHILKSLLLFAAVIALWFLYNFYAFGNFFAGIADQYANNILYRTYIISSVNFPHFLKVQTILIPFFILGLIIVLIKILKTIKSEKAFGFDSIHTIIDKLKIEIIMIFLLIFSILSYTNIPLKSERLLFNLILPTIYFAYIGIDYLATKIINIKFDKIKISKKLITTILIIIASVVVAITFALAFRASSYDYDPPDNYLLAINKMHELNIFNCSVESNVWIKLNYYNLSSAPFPRYELLDDSIDKGVIIILFKQGGEPEYKPEISINQNLIIYENNEFLILGKGECRKVEIFDKSYTEQLEYAIFVMRNYHINTNPCFTMFHNSFILEKTCNFVNFNGFVIDENRIVE